MEILAEPETKTILVVDDDKFTRDFLRILLAKTGFEIALAASGKDALQLLQQNSFHHFDLVILDLMLPDISGYSLLKEIRGEKYQQVPVFVLTGRSLDHGTQQIISDEANVEGFWRKPVEIKKFRSSLHSFLKTRPGRKDFEEAVPDLRELYGTTDI